jgi:hypothetical protein
MGKLPVMVPGIGKYDDNYELAYDLKDNTGLLKINAVIQKYIDIQVFLNLLEGNRHSCGVPSWRKRILCFKSRSPQIRSSRIKAA